MEEVKHNRAVYDAFRKQQIDYFQFPSLTFNPVPPGMRFVTEKKKPVFSKALIKKPDRIEDLAFCSVLQLAGLLRKRQVTSMELTKMYLSRLKQYDERLQFVVTLTEDLALRQAQKVDQEISAGSNLLVTHSSLENSA